VETLLLKFWASKWSAAPGFYMGYVAAKPRSSKAPPHCPSIIPVKGLVCATKQTFSLCRKRGLAYQAAYPGSASSSSDRHRFGSTLYLRDEPLP
jgi:hypothetical protein